MTPFTGTYWSEELGTEYRVEADSSGRGIVLQHRTRSNRLFRPTYRDGFFSGGDWLTFERGASGEVVGFTWSNGRVRKVQLERVRR